MATSQPNWPGPASGRATSSPPTAPRPAQTPWLITRTGPMDHSCHEFATASVPRQSQAQIVLPRVTNRYAASAAITSRLACIPVVTQLIAIPAATVQAGTRSRGHVTPYSCAASSAHTT